MADSVTPDTSNVVAFPKPARDRPSLALLSRIAPVHSFVDTLLAERGTTPHDAQAGFSREFAYQAQALEAGHDRDEAIIRLRVLVDAHVVQACQLCEDYRDAADSLVFLEIRTARETAATPSTMGALRAARAELRGKAIAAGVSADGALGAAAALTTYIRDGLVGLNGIAVGDGEPRQLQLFAAAAG